MTSDLSLLSTSPRGTLLGVMADPVSRGTVVLTGLNKGFCGLRFNSGSSFSSSSSLLLLQLCDV